MVNERKVIRYSQAFKLQVVREIEDGTFKSIEQARERYGIAGSATITKWLARMGRNDLMTKVVRVETPAEQDQIKALKKRVRDLEHALAESRMRELLAEGYYDTLRQECGMEEEPEKHKKKAPARPSAAPSSGHRARKESQ